MKPQADLPAIIEQINYHGMRTYLIRAFTNAFREARKGKLKTFNEHSYDERWPINIPHLVDAVLERYYKPSASISFIVYDPMVREIFAAPFVDRIIHHFLYDLQGGWWDHRFIHDSYSCRDGKGTLYGVLRTHQMMRRVTHNLKEPAYIIKLDVRGYFMSLPREALYQRIKWGLDRQFAPYMHQSAGFELYKLCCFLWRQVLMDDPAGKSHRRGDRSGWKILPPEKSLYCQPPGQGIVIGNLTSQLVSNIYLDQLDRFVKFELGYDYYGRYVDDFFYMMPSSEYQQAKHDVQVIERFLKERLRLTLHPKKRYYGSVYQGVSFLGYRIYPHCLYPSNRLQQKLRKIAYELKRGTARPEIVTSYFGLLAHMNADNFVKRLFNTYGLDYRLYEEIKRTDRRPLDEIIKSLMDKNEI